MNMTIPSYAEAVAIARKINVSGIMGREGLADFGIKFMREALATAQEPFNLEKRPVAFRYKNGVDEWELTDDEAVADAAVNAGHDAQGLYVRAATQEPAHFNGEQALAEWEGKHGGGK